MQKPARSKGAKTAHLLRACFCNFCRIMQKPARSKGVRMHTYSGRVLWYFEIRFDKQLWIKTNQSEPSAPT
jgi:hypothetical protein